MKKGTKELHIAVLAAVISIFLTGCQSEEEEQITGFDFFEAYPYYEEYEMALY